MLIAFIVGVLVGILFFGGLYLTVKKLTTIKYPALFMMLSLVARLVILSGGIYLIMDGGIQNVLSAMAGIILVRLVMIAKLGKAAPKETMEGG